MKKKGRFFEAEEKLKELFNLKIDPFRNSSPKIEISSRKDLLNLYNHSQKEKNLYDKELKPFCESLSSISSIDADDYHTLLALYAFFLQGGKTDKKDCRTYIKVGNRRIKYGSDEYNGLQRFCSKFKEQLERFFSIGDLCLSEKTLKRGSKEEDRTRYCYSKYENNLKALSDLCDKGQQQIDSVKKLDQAYREETKEENEKKFSCIRRFVIPACYFPILYRHFFVKDDLEYSDIGTVNKFLFRALKLENGDKSCVFVQETLSVGLRKETEKIENYHVNSSGKFSAFTGDRYGSLLHELMHFMNAIDCFEAAENAPNISLLTFKSEIIANTGVVSKLKFSKEDIYPKKEKKEKKENEEEEKEEEREESDKELDDEKLGDIRDKLEETLGYLYNNACEAWTMYGIFIWKDKQNPRKYEFYYEPINEADADVECKIINGEKRRVVRTGHFMFGDKKNRIDPVDETSPLKIGVLNKKIGIYQFYFDKGETLRNLINK